MVMFELMKIKCKSPKIINWHNIVPTYSHKPKQQTKEIPNEILMYLRLNQINNVNVPEVYNSRSHA